MMVYLNNIIKFQRLLGKMTSDYDFRNLNATDTALKPQYLILQGMQIIIL